MALLDATPSGHARAGQDCPLCPRLVAFREANQAAHPDWFNGAVPSFGPDGARLLIVGLAPGLEGRQPHRASLSSATMPASCSTARCSRSDLARGRHDVAAPEDARAGRLHDLERGALRAAAEQADAGRDRHLPPVPDRPHRRAAASRARCWRSAASPMTASSMRLQLSGATSRLRMARGTRCPTDSPCSTAIIARARTPIPGG